MFDTYTPRPETAGFLTLQGGDEMAPKSAISEVLKIQAQYEEARKAAISELLTQRKEIDDQLRSLGHGGTKAPVKGAGAVGDKPCSVCNFKTNPPHDARAHRSQKKKEPFTKADLDEKGLTKA